MKKFLAAALAFALTGSMLAGCSSNLPKDHSPFHSGAAEQAPSQVESTASATPTPPAANGALSTGLAVVNTVAKSVEPAEADGTAEMNSNIVAVLVDDAGRIVDCKIDAVQSKINFSKDGKLTTDPATMFATKNERGTDYGMGKASSIGKEWDEQAKALANYVIGKTIDEVKGIALTEGKASDAELAASVTISLGDLLGTIEKAVANAQPIGAQAGDRLGIGAETNMAKSKDAANGEDGLAQADSIYAAASFDADGKITSCVLDGSQSNVSFDTTGKITTDLAIAPQTKNELGDAYGMKQASGIGKEWNEQAAAFAAYALGKTVDEIGGIAVNDHGSPTDTELAASVTIGIGDFNIALGKAADSAKS